MLVMATSQLCNPVSFVIKMVTNNRLLHAVDFWINEILGEVYCPILGVLSHHFPGNSDFSPFSALLCIAVTRVVKALSSMNNESEFVKRTKAAAAEAADTVVAIARQYDTPIIVWANGETIEIDPYTERRYASPLDQQNPSES